MYGAMLQFIYTFIYLYTYRPKNHKLLGYPFVLHMLYYVWLILRNTLSIANIFFGLGMFLANIIILNEFIKDEKIRYL